MIGRMVSKYRIVELIGRGGMALVFKAQDMVSGQYVALKILAEKLVNDPDMLYRFQREGGAVSSLQHPNICSVFESGDWEGRPYLATELLTGRTLDAVLADGPLPTRQVIEIAIGVTHALEAAHEIGVIHRDLKPANLFLTDEGVVKVLDFGLAKTPPPKAPLGDDSPTIALRITRKNVVLGTFAYMSPEQVCCEPLDGRADLYSLGVVIHELATGKLPVRGVLDKAALPTDLTPIVAKLMAAEPRLRYQTAREARDALKSAPTSAGSSAG